MQAANMHVFVSLAAGDAQLRFTHLWGLRHTCDSKQPMIKQAHSEPMFVPFRSRYLVAPQSFTAEYDTAMLCTAISAWSFEVVIRLLVQIEQ